jgi:parallel beta-helix repeat protein
MARNGSGTYSLPVNTWNPAVNGVGASAADWQSLINDVASALTASLAADGQTPMTGNLAMGGNRLTGLAAGTATGNSLRYEQVFGSSGLTTLAASGGSDLVGFLQTGTGAVTRTGQAKLREVFSLADFGAVGDGLTDDGAAIDLAITAATAGAVITGVPGSTYRIVTGCTVSKSLTFRGIKFEQGANVSMFTLTSGNIAFEGCEWDLSAGSTTSAKAIYAQSQDNIRIIGNKFTDGYYGIYLESCTRVLIDGNRCSDSLHWHIFVDGGNYITIVNNVCRGGAYDGIKIASATAGVGVERSIANVVIANNVCEGNERDGIDCATNECDNLLIANNVLTNNKLTAIEVKTVLHADSGLTYNMRNVLIDGNVCRNGPNTDSATTLISVQSGGADYAARTLGSQLVEDVTIRNNKCYLEQVGTDSGYSIRVVDATKATIENNDIIYRMTGGGGSTGQIRIHYGLNTAIRENDIDCAGAAMSCISASSFGTANPTTGVVITENKCISGASSNPITIPDAAVSGTEVYENRLFPDVGQYALADSGTGTVYSANYRGTTTGAPTTRGRPGDYYLETNQGEGYPERWTCTVIGNPGTWKGMNQRGFRTNAGSPAGSVTPTYAGEMLYDTTNSDWYKASGTANTSWTQLSN